MWLKQYWQSEKLREMGIRNLNEQHDSAADDLISSLGNTVDTFASRLQQKLGEQEVKQNIAQVKTQARHARMLNALNTIRRALQETGRIKLGERFRLDVEVSDWDGWPRLELNLIDNLEPENNDYSLIVSAHDRGEMGVIEYRTRKGEQLGALSLAEEQSVNKIPTVLKRSVRLFLDIVAAYVLNPKSADELNRGKIDLEEEAQVVDPTAARLKNTDVFTEEDYIASQNLVESEAPADALAVSFDKI